MDSPNHLLSLKVMRISRPSLASAWQPFYSSSEAFSAHSTASILSLQGRVPLSGHPKTLRDLTHASELLTLPASFGPINLGEVFESCLCVNNESRVDVEAVTVKVELRTPTTKTVLTEIGGEDFTLPAADTLEKVVRSEIKELGQHVLACTVQYCLPQNVRNIPGHMGNDNSPKSFTKFYKFSVTNPLSVKTKVHVPRSPSALLSATEREKIFLEVHIQNLTQEAIWFERMRFECVEGWKVDDANVVDMRQYIYILYPTTMTQFPTTHAPGSIIPLGRVDISWRSSFGEPGRLLTSMLSRRIPIPAPPPAQPAPSALPFYLQRSPSTVSATSLARTSSQHSPSRPGSPSASGPTRPGSPARNRPSRPTSPGVGKPGLPLALAFPLESPRPTSDVEVDLIVKAIPRDFVVIGQPFSVQFRLTVLASPPPAGEQRELSLVVQHVQSAVPDQARAGLPSSAQTLPPGGSFSPQLPSAISAASVASTHHDKTFSEASRDDDTLHLHHSHLEQVAAPLLPPPYARSGESRASGITFAGPSALFLPPIKISRSDRTSGPPVETDDLKTKALVVQDFELSYVPAQKGFTTIGGLRVLLIGDEAGHWEGTEGGHREARILKDWDVVGDVWVKTF